MKKNYLFLALILLVGLGAFLGGRISVKNSQGGEVAGEKEGTVVFSPEKQEKANIKFFVMSFCPYGNQAEEVLKPVFELLGSESVDWEPRYIVSKMTLEQIKQSCEPQIYNASRCADYVSQGYFTDTASCKERLFANVDECVAAQGKMVNGTIYTSLHGVGELNQDVREICVWNSEDDKSKWWNFVDGVNKNCTSEDVDDCWQAQAETAGIDTNGVNQCFETQYGSLLDKEIAATEEFAVSSSPTFLINGEKFPPQEAYPATESEVVELKIGKEIFSVNQYRTPNALKTAICAGMDNPPKECDQVLQDTVRAASGGC